MGIVLGCIGRCCRLSKRQARQAEEMEERACREEHKTPIIMML